MDALGIEKSEMESVITKGMKWKEKHIEKWHASIRGIECECVFLKKENLMFIITVYENGGKK